MNSRRAVNAQMAIFCGAPTPRAPHVPSKSDLFKVLDTLRFKEMPEVSAAREALSAATKARRRFERRSKTWKQLRKAEQAAERKLQRIRPLVHERRDEEIKECRTLLRLYGVTPVLLERIERLVHGDDDVSNE